MKKIRTAAAAAFMFSFFTLPAFADTAAAEEKGLINIPGLPSWVPRAGILLLLLFLAVRPMIPDYIEQRKRRKQ